MTSLFGTVQRLLSYFKSNSAQNNNRLNIQFSGQSAPEYPATFQPHAVLLTRYYAEEPLTEEEFETAEYLSVDYHGLIAGMSYWSAEDSSLCVSCEFGQQIAAAMADVKQKGAQRLAARNSIEAFLTKHGLANTQQCRGI